MIDKLSGCLKYLNVDWILVSNKKQPEKRKLIFQAATKQHAA
ncbi:hypothetical protein [Kingella negevensis]|nr:hypothetical protein [Kingella negevensis]MDK4684447.1 hypothetical protein [Kingella negevensis]MDK4688779.1 hypothetical protein [Kingella negevensis]MDK4696901.1 hypothetical protein [Kingella negevensis]MDK4708080.1 hypothetical protein [Kingella negevensis]MDK4709645.1 hypothetical protein [Kingella negevensis]